MVGDNVGDWGVKGGVGLGKWLESQAVGGLGWAWELTIEFGQRWGCRLGWRTEGRRAMEKKMIVIRSFQGNIYGRNVVI